MIVWPRTLEGHLFTIVVVMISDQTLSSAALHVSKNVWMMIKLTVLGVANIATEEDHEVCRTHTSGGVLDLRQPM